MPWNHRVVKDRDWYSIRECFYDSENHPTPRGWTENWRAPFGGTLEELREELVMMLQATYKDVLEEDK